MKITKLFILFWLMMLFSVFIFVLAILAFLPTIGIGFDHSYISQSSSIQHSQTPVRFDCGDDFSINKINYTRFSICVDTITGKKYIYANKGSHGISFARYSDLEE